MDSKGYVRLHTYIPAITIREEKGHEIYLGRDDYMIEFRGGKGRGNVIKL